MNNNYNVRINDNFLKADYSDGQVLQHTDLNEFESVVKTAINANYEDIQKLEDGTIPIGSAESLSGATLSTYESGSLQNSDTKIPTSMQVKQYVDASVSAIDLGGYYTKREIDGIVEIYDSTGNGIVDNAEKVNNHTVDKDVPSNAVFTDTVYDDTEVRGLIQTNTDNISSINSNLTNNYVTNTSLASTLTSYVKPTDYASNSKGGTIKSSSDYATSVLGSGFLTANNYTFSQYQSHGNNMFISKGTLENVITGKELTNKTYVDTGLAAKQGTLTAGSNITISGNTISATDTTYSNATTETAGLMSAEDKTKLDSQIIEMVSDIEGDDMLNLSTSPAGIYRVKGNIYYYYSNSIFGDMLEILETLDDYKTFIVSDYYKPVKMLSYSLTMMNSMALSSNNFMQRQIICVEDNKIIIAEKVKQGANWNYGSGLAANVNLNAYLGQPILIWQNTTVDSVNNSFSPATLEIKPEYTSFLKDNINNSYNLFIEIVYVSNITDTNTIANVKTTGKIPLTDDNDGSSTKTSLEIPKTNLDVLEVNSSTGKLEYHKRPCTIYMRSDATDNTIKNIYVALSNCGTYDTSVGTSSSSDDKWCVPLYIYLYKDNNAYEPNDFTA